MEQQSVILITGASSGIGTGFARHFAGQGCQVLAVARRKERLEALQQEYPGKIRILVEDLNDPGAVQRIHSYCQSQGLYLEGLINNAGLGKQGPLREMETGSIGQMLQVNIRTLTELTRLFLPDMVERKSGFVLNVASTAGFQPVPYFAVYAASKAYVLSFSEALHEEVSKFGIKVSALCPGPVATEFQQVAGMHPRFFARSQTVDEVVKAGLRLIASNRAVGWTSWFQMLFTVTAGMMPRVLIRKTARQIMRLSGAGD